MKSVSKKSVVVITCFALAILFTTGAFAALTGAWHSLQQVSTDSTGTTSVDENANGKVDDSDRLEGLHASEILASSGTGGAAGSFWYVQIQHTTGCSDGRSNVVLTPNGALFGDAGTSRGAGIEINVLGADNAYRVCQLTRYQTIAGRTPSVTLKPYASSGPNCASGEITIEDGNVILVTENSVTLMTRPVQTASYPTVSTLDSAAENTYTYIVAEPSCLKIENVQ